MASNRLAGFVLPLVVAAGVVSAALSLGSIGCGASNASNAGDVGGDDAGGTGPGTDDGGSPSGDGGGATGDGGTSPGTDGGTGGGDSGAGCVTNNGPISGTVGNNGGSISRLVFGVVGDTRPVNSDDVSGYPTSIITKIFQDIEAQSPHPPFVIATGDYQFSSTGSNATASQQVALYMQARGAYNGAFFPAMGNHECGVSGGFTTSDNNNCGPGNPGGVTPNYTAFMSKMLAPISKSTPYYAINVAAIDKSWTAKIVVTAANSWDTAQQTWLQTTMAQATTYTFVIRHEASDATPPLPPGVAGVDSVIAQYPYTMLIVGHAHTYGHYKSQPKVVIIGNGGAPLSSKNYGYVLFSQRCDGAMVVDEYDYQSGATDSVFHFVITPQGTLTQ